jgi:AcrR family transcriptional regulator
MDGGPGGFVMRHETVDLIFNAAIEVFAESGFDQAKMDDIARAAGVAKGTIYYHFKSKEELFVGLMNEGVQKLIDRARRYLNSHKSPTDQLLALVENQIHFYVQNGKLAKLLLNEAFGTKTRQVQFRRKIGEYLQLIEEVMIEGNRLGEFQIKHVPEAASAIFGAASVVVLQKLYSMEEVDPARIERDIPPMVETVRRMVLCGIKDSTYC